MTNQPNPPIFTPENEARALAEIEWQQGELDITNVDIWRVTAIGSRRVPDCRWNAVYGCWEGLHHAVCEKEATHWMPLPGAPK